MIPALGELFFLSALGLSALAVFWFRPFKTTLSSTRTLETLPAWIAACFTISFLCLTLAFLQSDFSLLPVMLHSAVATPWYYKLSAAWSHHEGSLLLWLSFMSYFQILLSHHPLPLFLKAHTLWAYNALILLIGGFTFLTSYPFKHLLIPALDGNDLNPLLQDFSVILHPPIVFAGFASLAPSFALAIGMLLVRSPSQDTAWRCLRFWTRWSVVLLTFGITLGSFWAFYELGWGGWWFWDPVENASLLPWLSSIALLHALHIVARKSTHMRWALFLSLLGFCLVLVGTLLVRSGLVTSVHSFAQDPDKGFYLSLILTLVMGGGFSLFSLAHPHFRTEPRSSLYVQSLQLQTILFVIAALTLLFGTLYPSLIALFTDYRLSVGAPYFEATVLPILFPTLLLLGITPFYSTPISPLRALMPFTVACGSLLVGMGWSQEALSFKGFCSLGAFCVGLWVIGLTFYRWWVDKSQGIGILLAHLGVGILALAISGESLWHQEWIVPLKKGEALSLSPHLSLTWQEETSVEGPNFVGDKLLILLKTSAAPDGVLLTPEKRWYIPGHKFSSETSIKLQGFQTYTLTCGETTSSQIRMVRFSVHPMIVWLWIGAGLMILGVTWRQIESKRLRQKRK